ncbi:hypothetical protein M569_12443, partial [Genlisea aurea]
PPPEPEHLPCPRCDSTNTKFCYYNNYNFSQPRHFCKSCRRYWTHGGTLRDIPVGGGSRKNAKRSRTGPAAMGSAATGVSGFAAAAAAAHHGFSASGDHGGGAPCFGDFLNAQGWGLGGFGFGFGQRFGLEDVGFGIGRSLWPISGFVESGSGSMGGSSAGGYAWQSESGGGGFPGGGDCFVLPELAISTPGGSL